MGRLACEHPSLHRLWPRQGAVHSRRGVTRKNSLQCLGSHVYPGQAGSTAREVRALVIRTGDLHSTPQVACPPRGTTSHCYRCELHPITVEYPGKLDIQIHDQCGERLFGFRWLGIPVGISRVQRRLQLKNLGSGLAFDSLPRCVHRACLLVVSTPTPRPTLIPSPSM